MMASLLIHEQPLIFLPTLAKKAGVNEAIVLQQLHYWLGKEGGRSFFDGRHWLGDIYGRCRSYAPFLMWTDQSLYKIINSLVQNGYLTAFRPEKGDREFFTIDYGFLSAILAGGISSPILKYTSPKNYFLEQYRAPPVNPSNQNYPSGQGFREGIENICRQMVTIWNRLTHPCLYHENRDPLPKAARSILVNFLAIRLIPQGVTWQNYCAAINKIPSPKQVTWKYLTLEWATNPLNFPFVMKIMSANNPCQTYPFEEKPYELFLKDIGRKVPHNRFRNQWLAIAGILVRAIGQARFQALFSQASVSKFKGKSLALQVPDSLTRDYILTFMLDALVQVINKVYPLVDTLEIEARD